MAKTSFSDCGKYFWAGVIVALVFLGAVFYFAFPTVLQWCIDDRAKLNVEVGKLKSAGSECQGALGRCTASLGMCNGTVVETNATMASVSADLARCEADKQFYQKKLNEKCGTPQTVQMPARVFFGLFDVQAFALVASLLALVPLAIKIYGEKNAKYNKQMDIVMEACLAILFLIFLLITLGFA